MRSLPWGTSLRLLALPVLQPEALTRGYDEHDGMEAPMADSDEDGTVISSKDSGRAPE